FSQAMAPIPVARHTLTPAMIHGTWVRIPPDDRPTSATGIARNGNDGGPGGRGGDGGAASTGPIWTRMVLPHPGHVTSGFNSLRENRSLSLHAGQESSIGIS